MPIEDKDHMSYMGSKETKEDFGVFFYEIFKRLDNLQGV